jgi:hypothetical protein
MFEEDLDLIVGIWYLVLQNKCCTCNVELEINGMQCEVYNELISDYFVFPCTNLQWLEMCLAV